MQFDETCRPVESRRFQVTGNWDGASFIFAGLFTVASGGPVDAVVTVSATDPTWPLHLALLGYNPQAPNPPGTFPPILHRTAGRPPARIRDGTSDEPLLAQPRD